MSRMTASDWCGTGNSRASIVFGAIAFDLFRFGARVYARYQPQFLHEFVLDNMNPDQSSLDYAHCAEMRAAAQEALALARRAGR